MAGYGGSVSGGGVNVDRAIINAISLCSGVGMLDEGLHAGLGYLGIRSRTILYAEREAYPVSVLEARMEEGSIHPAPIWFGDFTELPARQFHGMVDCIVAGFPCQDISVAGKRAGLDGARSGLFFEIPRIADDCGAWLMLLENVAGIATATASVVDAEEGELDERAAARVVGELADLGWDAEWITISASDVGASHGRARWFCLAWRVANSSNIGHERRARAGREEIMRTEFSGEEYVGNTENRRREFETRTTRIGGSGFTGNDIAMADTSSTRPQGLQLGRACNSDRGGQETHGPTSELCGLFAPGPSDPGWADIIREHPHLAPALEHTFRGVVNGLAFDMGDCRAARLKCVGNGVVAAQAGCATAILIRRSGIGA